MTEQPEPNRITAATDGSSRGSPGAGGWGWVTDAGRCDWGSEPRATHIRMELTAMLELLRSHPRGRLLIQSDNKYVIDVFTKWLSQWRKRNMRKADGKPPKHLDIIEEIDTLQTGGNVEWQWVKAHAGHALNEKADRLAGRGSTMAFRTELTALMELLPSHPRGRLPIQSDNKHLINTFTEWLPKWRERNMRKADGKPVENRDLIKEIDRLLTGWDVEWQEVKGQSGPLLKLRHPSTET